MSSLLLVREHSLLSFPQNLCLPSHQHQQPPIVSPFSSIYAFIHLSITGSSYRLHASSLVTVVSSLSFQIRKSPSFQTVVCEFYIAAIDLCIIWFVNHIWSELYLVCALLCSKLIESS